ncbi:putative AdoMet-dependent methyltransferase [Evansella caseinilytica]|uniref:Uncharacterized methyltransferase SAMN05421736_103318 n=1 Tax=Evansella caseinilytica TaxID=1503961 RepID=A0A1H3MS81_9BACI|nr:class I SAM-dependent methyltransferase [Evansella caseinilytica]SDY79383.1 putative AdoMet-dependent methyltransferase [Evansella caseinilytica]
MGREFVDLFNHWAETYDATVSGMDEEYKEVFEGYGTILQGVVEKIHGSVVEFGVGTGNLTRLLAAKADHVLGVEPSEKMREEAVKKLVAIDIVPGDFLHFPVPERPIDAIVSSYAFHHLTDEEKAKATSLYASLLNTGGKVVFADTMFTNKQQHQALIQEAIDRHFLNLATDLQTEYYTTIPILTSLFEEAGFSVSFTQMNKYVWMLEAVKK